jgi:hypothetical protein
MISHLESKAHGFSNRPTWLSTNSYQNSIAQYGTKIVQKDEKLRKIVTLFATHSLARSMFHAKEYKNAHPNDYPTGATFKEFEDMYSTLFKENEETVKREIGRSTCQLEMDGGKKSSKDYINVLLSGRFVDTWEAKETETKENVIKTLTELKTSLEDRFETCISSITNDNCGRVDYPAHEFCWENGILHTRCFSHGFNLTLKDLFQSDETLTLMYAKLRTVVHVIMQVKKNRNTFIEKQKSWEPRKEKAPLRVGESVVLYSTDSRGFIVRKHVRRRYTYSCKRIDGAKRWRVLA